MKQSSISQRRDASRLETNSKRRYTKIKTVREGIQASASNLRMDVEEAKSYETIGIRSMIKRTTLMTRSIKMMKKIFPIRWDTARIDQNNWIPPVLDSGWSALCKTFYGGVKQEDWESMYNTPREATKTVGIKKIDESTSLLPKLSKKKKSGSDILREKLESSGQKQNAGLVVSMEGVSAHVLRNCREKVAGGADDSST